MQNEYKIMEFKNNNFRRLFFSKNKIFEIRMSIYYCPMRKQLSNSQILICFSASTTIWVGRSPVG